MSSCPIRPIRTSRRSIRPTWYVAEDEKGCLVNKSYSPEVFFGRPVELEYVWMYLYVCVKKFSYYICLGEESDGSTGCCKKSKRSLYIRNNFVFYSERHAVSVKIQASKEVVHSGYTALGQRKQCWLSWSEKEASFGTTTDMWSYSRDLHSIYGVLTTILFAEMIKVVILNLVLIIRKFKLKGTQSRVTVFTFNTLCMLFEPKVSSFSTERDVPGLQTWWQICFLAEQWAPRTVSGRRQISGALQLVHSDPCVNSYWKERGGSRYGNEKQMGGKERRDTRGEEDEGRHREDMSNG